MTAATALLEIISVRIEQIRYRPEMATRHQRAYIIHYAESNGFGKPGFAHGFSTHSIPRIRKIMPQSTAW